MINSLSGRKIFGAYAFIVILFTLVYCALAEPQAGSKTEWRQEIRADKHFHYAMFEFDNDYLQRQKDAENALERVLRKGLHNGQDICQLEYTEGIANSDGKFLSDIYPSAERWDICKFEIYGLHVTRRNIEFNAESRLNQGNGRQLVTLENCSLSFSSDWGRLIECPENGSFSVDPTFLKLGENDWKAVSNFLYAEGEISKWVLFRRMLYFSVVCATGLGFGDIVPVSDFSRILVTAEAFLGLLVMGAAIGVIVRPADL